MSLPADVVEHLNRHGARLHESMGGCYDRNGSPIGFGDMLALAADRGYTQLEFDRVGDIEISTVWLGFDLLMGRGLDRQLFETMVSSPAADHQIVRYTSEADARDGHRRIVEQLAGTQP